MENKSAMPRSLMDSSGHVFIHADETGGKVDIVFRPILPHAKLGGFAFSIDEKPSVIVNKKKIFVDEIH